MKPLEMFDRPIAFQRAFVELTGSITGALLLSQACYWQKRTTSEDGWWYKTHTEFEEEIGLTRRELETARQHCALFLKHEVRGIPAKSHYKVDEDAIYSVLGLERKSIKTQQNPVCTNPPSSLAESAVQFGGIRHSTNTETTTETTTKEGLLFGEEVKKDKTAQSIPKELDTQEFRVAWEEWNQHRKEIKKTQTPMSVSKQLKKLAKIGVTRSIAAINHSIEKAFTGIYEENTKSNGYQNNFQQPKKVVHKLMDTTWEAK